MTNGSIKNGTILSQSTVGLGLRDSQQGEAQLGRKAPVVFSQRKCPVCGCFMAKIEETPEYILLQCTNHADETARIDKVPVDDYWVPSTKEDLEILELRRRRISILTPEFRRRLSENVGLRKWRPMWTPTDVEVLIAVYEDPTMYTYEAANRLGRTRYAVECKASELGLKKRLREWPE